MRRALVATGAALLLAAATFTVGATSVSATQRRFRSVEHHARDRAAEYPQLSHGCRQRWRVLTIPHVSHSRRA
jgi:hypothetical protein